MSVDDQINTSFQSSKSPENCSSDVIMSSNVAEEAVNCAENSSERASNGTPSSNLTSPLIAITPPSEDCSVETPSIQISSPNGVTISEDPSSTPSMSSTQRESSEPPGDSDEEYFEEYHLPNTHENAFVRHLSFRRKVQNIPIDAPDAEQIEGLVRTGEFVLHGNIKKKILPEVQLEEQYEDEEEYADQEEYDDPDEHDQEKNSSFSKRIERDLREIERYLSEDNVEASLTDSYDQTLPKDTARNKKLKRTTSTPKPVGESDMGTCVNGDTNTETGVGAESSQNFEESLSIEDTTLRKIQECLDFSSYKNLLNLSGRLIDLLSPKEVEEVLLNSERYRQYLDSEVFEALSLSFQGQTQSLPCNINVSLGKTSNSNTNQNQICNSQSNSSSSSSKSIPTTDSGFSSPKSRKEEKVSCATLEGPNDDLHFYKTSAEFDGIRAQGIFVETPGSNSNLRRIPAPEINLNWSSETKPEDSEDESFEVVESKEEFSSRKRISVSEGILGSSFGSETVDEEEGGPLGFRDEEMEITRASANVSSETEPPLPDMFPVPPPPDRIPELTGAEEFSEVRHWRNVVIGGAWRRIDMKVISPYRKCISHGGYMEDNPSPLVVLSAALLPEKSRRDYHYIMDNLFMYVLSFLEQLVADNYVLIYFSGGRKNGSGPGFHWMRRAYEMIDRRLRKNLKSLLVVHPSLWARTILTLSRPFISSKFYRKLNFVHNLTDLAQLVPLEQLEIPDAVKQADFEIMIKEKKRQKVHR